MKKRQYKIKIENGQITPLELIDIQEAKEGIVIFFELEGNENLFNKSTAESMLKYAGTWSGDDFENCLEEVYNARGKAKF